MTIMSNMISELRGASHELTDKQQVQVVTLMQDGIATDDLRV